MERFGKKQHSYKSNKILVEDWQLYENERSLKTAVNERPFWEEWD